MLIGPDHVRLRWIGVDEVGAADIAGLETLLDERERAQARRFRRDADRRAYVAGHALVRASLAQFAGRAPRDWDFCAGPYGKPEPIFQPNETNIRFSLSHSGGIAAVALTTAHDIGVDVERMEDRTASSEVRAALAPSERDFLSGLPPHAASAAFYRIWTLKEAYLKAIGTGLSRPLESFSVTLDPIAIIEADDRASPNWFLAQVALDSAHVAAVAVRHQWPQRVDLGVEALDAGTLLGLARSGSA